MPFSSIYEFILFRCLLMSMSSSSVSYLIKVSAVVAFITPTAMVQRQKNRCRQRNRWTDGWMDWQTKTGSTWSKLKKVLPLFVTFLKKGKKVGRREYDDEQGGGGGGSCPYELITQRKGLYEDPLEGIWGAAAWKRKVRGGQFIIQTIILSLSFHYTISLFPTFQYFEKKT